MAEGGHKEYYTVQVDYDGASDTSAKFKIKLKRSTAIDQNDLDFDEVGYTDIGNVGDSFTVVSKYHQSSQSFVDLILQAFYDGNLLQLNQVILYYYDGGTSGSVAGGTVPGGYTQNWIDKLQFATSDLPGTRSQNDNWITAYYFTIINPLTSTFLLPYLQTKQG